MPRWTRPWSPPWRPSAPSCVQSPDRSERSWPSWPRPGRRAWRLPRKSWPAPGRTSSSSGAREWRPPRARPPRRVASFGCPAHRAGAQRSGPEQLVRRPGPLTERLERLREERDAAAGGPAQRKQAAPGARPRTYGPAPPKGSTAAEQTGAAAEAAASGRRGHPLGLDRPGRGAGSGARRCPPGAGAAATGGPGRGAGHAAGPRRGRSRLGGGLRGSSG